MSKLKTHHYFWITAVFILLIGVSSFFDENDVIDINVHDTYFVIRNSHLATLLFVIYGIIGLVYWFFYKKEIILIRNLTSVHTIITSVSIYIYEIGMIYYSLKTETNFPLFDDFSSQNSFTLIIVMLVLLTQLLFITNIILSTIKYSIYYFQMKKR
jgi:heme/copper-type cytochrome/quinol oxidase subunit 1